MIDPTSDAPLVTLEELGQATDTLLAASSTSGDVEPLVGLTDRASVGVQSDGKDFALEADSDAEPFYSWMPGSVIMAMTDEQRDELVAIDEVLQEGRRRRLAEVDP